MDITRRIESHVGADTQVAVVTSYQRREAQMAAFALELMADGCWDDWAIVVGWQDRLAAARRSEAAESPHWSALEVE